MSSMMHMSMVSPLSPQHQLIKILKLFQEEVRDKLEYGKLEKILKQCKLQWNNTEVVSGQFK